MSAEFDPYRKWLGIPPVEQPPNHYRLLGIAVFEDDPDVIAYAADRQMSHVRKFQSGQHGEQAQKLLSELANARRCLLAAGERKAYDKELQQELGKANGSGSKPVAAPQPGKKAPVPAPPPTTVTTSAGPTPPEAEPPVATAQVPKAQPIAKSSHDSPVPAVRSRRVSSVARRGRRKSSALPIVVALCTLACFAALGLVVVLAMTADMAEDATENPNPQPPPTTRVQQPDVEETPRENRRASPPRRDSRHAPSPDTSPNNTPAEEGDQTGSSIGPLANPNGMNSPDRSNTPPSSSNDPPEDEPLIPDDEKTPDLPENFPDADGSLPRPGGA